MPAKDVRPKVKEVVFADDDPTVGTIFPHGFHSRGTKGWVGKPMERFFKHLSVFDGQRQLEKRL
jgi:hypothetical protein